MDNDNIEKLDAPTQQKLPFADAAAPGNEAEEESPVTELVPTEIAKQVTLTRNPSGIFNIKMADGTEAYDVLGLLEYARIQLEGSIQIAPVMQLLTGAMRGPGPETTPGGVIH